MAKHNGRARKRKHRNNSNWKPILLIGGGVLLIALALGVFIPGVTGEATKTVEQPGAQQYAESRLSNGLPSVIPVEVDYPAPDLTLTDLNGNPDALENYRGKVVLVNNWATWCPPCTAEMPELQAFYQQHKDEGFVIIAIEAGDPVEQVRAFVEKNRLTFPVWVDSQNQSLRTFRNSSLPNSVVIDRDGRVRLAWTGAISQEVLETHVAPLLNE